MKRLLLVLTMFLIATTVSAFSVGKLTGVVKDKKTGEPIIGANVMIEGTFLGGAADLDGKYTIYNIPVGEYTLIASAVGYQKTRVAKVVIKNNLTTTQPISMTTEDIMLGEEIVVEAEAPLIQKDLTSSAVTVTASELKTMPVENIGQVINLQAGVVDGHFRGGRSNEVQYLIDGIPVTDSYNYGRGIQVENNSIRQLEVISGTFNAEYGNANSAIINITSNDGSVSDFSSSFQAYMGSYYSTDKYFYNIDKIGQPNSMDLQASFSGPVKLLDNVSFFSSVRYYNDSGFYFGKRKWRTSDNYIDSTGRPIIFPTGDNKIIAMQPDEFYTINGKLTWQVPGIKLSLNTFFDDHINQYYNHQRKYSPDGRMTHFAQNLASTLQLTLIPTTQLTHTFSLSFQNYNYNGYAFEDPFDPRYRPPGTGSPITNVDLFWMGGGTENDRYTRFSNKILAKYDLTYQVNDIHKIKAGVEGKYHNLFNEYKLYAATEEQGVIIMAYNAMHTENFQRWQKIPYEYAAYIQDKIEYDIMIINLGLRFDYFQPNTRVPFDLYNPNRLPNFPGTEAPVEADAQYQISPRFGVSFPITDEGVIYFSYGHFFQIPGFEYIYSRADLPITLQSSLSTTYGNGNLRAQKTVSYELGLQQVLPYQIGLKSSVYYRDIRDLVGSTVIKTYTDQYYALYTNKDYGNAVGMIMSLDRRMGDMLSIQLDYTLQTVKGSESDPQAALYYQNSGLEPEKLVRPLNWDQQHTLNLALTVSDYQSWSVSTIITWGSGQRFTPDASLFKGIRFLNDGVKPTTWGIDVKADKSFMVGDYRINGFLLIYNLLDIRNEYGVAATTGRAIRDVDFEEDTRPFYPAAMADDYFNDPTRYSGPRTVKLGIGFSF